jgi:hypothetical protein
MHKGRYSYAVYGSSHMNFDKSSDEFSQLEQKHVTVNNTDKN